MELSEEEKREKLAEFERSMNQSRLGYYQGSQEEEADQFKPKKWSDLKAEKFPEQRWRIRNLIPQEGFTVLAAISGEKKTWVAMEMAKAIVSGKNFLGESRFDVTPANVLYIDMEMSKSEFQRRGKQLDLPSDETAEFQLFVNTQGCFSFNGVTAKEESLSELQDFVNENKISVVFIDTFRAVAGGLKEEKAEEVRAFFNQFKHYKNENVSLVWLDHFRKPSNFEGKIPKKEHLFASQDKVASVEILLMMKSEDGTNEIHVYQRKNRLMNEISPFKIIMEDKELEDGTKRTFMTYGGELDDMDSAKDLVKEFLVGFLEKEGRDTNEILRAVSSQIKVGSKNTRSALKDLEREGILIVGRQGKKNFYTLKNVLNEIVDINNDQDFGIFDPN